MPVQAYVDESGGKGQSRHFVMAGLIAESESWAHFSDEWRACLDQSPRVRCFKMREAASCCGSFDRWSEQERDAKLLALAKIINRHAKYVTFSAIDLDAHADTWAPAVSDQQILKDFGLAPTMINRGCRLPLQNPQ